MGDIFSRLSYPSRHSPSFLISVPLFVPSCLSLSISTSCLLERSHFPLMCTRWDFSLPLLSVTESHLLSEIIYVPTPCTRQTRERYLSSRFIPEEPRLKLLFCQMEHSHSESLFLFPRLSLFTTFAETDECSN